MSRKARAVLAALAIGIATLFASGSASAQTRAEFDEFGASAGTAVHTTPPSGGSVGILASACTTLTTGGGAQADVCRASYTEGDGNGYHGWFAGTVFGASFAQVYIDGAIANLDRPDGGGTFRHAGNVRLRVCNSNGCGAWW